MKRKSREYKETKVERSQCPICLTIFVVGAKECDCPTGQSMPNPTRELRGYNKTSRKNNGYK